jgi:hypothetical protein
MKTKRIGALPTGFSLMPGSNPATHQSLSTQETISVGLGRISVKN